MIRLLLWRLAIAVPLLFVVSFATFVLMAIAPGDPAGALLGTSATPERIAEVHAQLGLDKPLLTQYWDWVVAALQGDLGTSLVNGQSVAATIFQRVGVTVSLVVGATLVATIGGLAVGLWTARRSGWISRLIERITVVVAAIPPFWLGFLLIGAFAIEWRIFPATGYITPQESVGQWLRSLILPVATLVAAPLMGIAKQTRDSTQDVMSREYITALRADGMSERRVLWRHGLKNAAIPIVTLVSVYFIGMLGGTVFAETVFSLPGLGNLAVSSAQTGDYPVEQGVVIVLCAGVIAVNLAVELIYGWLNPKARQV